MKREEAIQVPMVRVVRLFTPEQTHPTTPRRVLSPPSSQFSSILHFRQWLIGSLIAF